MKDYTYEDLIKSLNTYMDEDYIDFVNKYYNKALEIYSGLKRTTGEEYISHPINVAYILSELKMDPVTIGCALIHEAITLNKMTYEEIESEFGTLSANIVLSITKISNLRQTFKVNSKEKYRRIIVGLCDNASTLFIKLADRLHNLRTLDMNDKEHVKSIVSDTQNIYIPIAHRLGLKYIKSEMEDLCLRATVKDEYNKILNRINASSNELNASLEKMKNSICEILDAHNIKYEIVYRVKSVRGIYNKLAAGRKWEDIYDLLGLRVLTNSVEDCYRVIGLVQAKYQPIANRFKDYIANPKANNYQSLHTTVFGEDGRVYEVQVRTYEMNEIAEKGIASHYSYKEHTNGSVKNSFDTVLESLRTLIELNDIESNMEFFGNIKEELKKNQIYVFTPKGDIIELPSGSTPIDFAYKIHSEVGNTTTGALVNSKMVKLNYELQDGDLVELITQKGHAPSKGWLKIVKTEGARSRIKSYFYKNERDKYILMGKEMLMNECKKKNIDFNELIKEENIEKIKTSLNLETLDDIYFSISTLRYLPSTIISKIDNKNVHKVHNTILEKKKSNNGILVAGQSDILCSIADCCKPVYGEDIVGYITRGYGVKIHSKTCSNIDLNSDRIIDAAWSSESNNKYNSMLRVYIDKVGDVIMNILSISKKYDINIDGFNLINRNNELFYDINLKVNDIKKLYSFMDEIKGINEVIKLERIYL